VTVLDGEISKRIPAAPGDAETYRTGSTFTSDPGEYIEVGNANPASARIIAAAVLPKGAPLMTVDQAGSGTGTDSISPTTTFESSIAVDRPAGAFELVHLVLDLDPGVWTPRHMHGGQEQVIVTSGEMTLQRHDEAEVFAAGESWTNASGVVHAAGNDGGSFAQVAVAFLLPAGRPLTTVV
jgi:quercetin dioxygenase-like cupin family protein